MSGFFYSIIAVYSAISVLQPVAVDFVLIPIQFKPRPPDYQGLSSSCYSLISLRNGTATGYNSQQHHPFGNRLPSGVFRHSNWNIIMAEGTIKKLTDKGFGFIKTTTDKDIFFHSKALQGVEFDDLQEGQKVTYTEGRGPKGPCAENVKLA